MKKIVTRTPEQVYKQWLKALRSGKYKQGQFQLRLSPASPHSSSAAKFCCLGVLCDLAVKDGGPAWGVVFWDESDTPPDEMIDYLGLTEEDVLDLIELNDDDGRTLSEIADYIEYVVMPDALERLKGEKVGSH